MTRIFHTVGQGAFYTEEFDNFTMVYDCGGNSEEIIKREIKGIFTKDQDIDALFISHFHNDHINGLEYLLKYCKVKTVYLPLLYKYAYVQLIIENDLYGDNSSFMGELCRNPAKTIRETSQNKDVQVIYITPSDQDVDGNRDDNITYHQSGHSISINDKKFRSCEWHLVPYNFQYTALNDKLVPELEEAHIDINKIENELKTKRKAIIEVYESVLKDTKNFNVNSLVLYSGPKVDDMCHFYIRNIFYKDILDEWRYGRRKSGCLYMGDYNVSEQKMMDDLKSAYSVYWDFLGTIQMPHHGSKYNFNIDLIKRRILAIMSVGRNNRYRHPHAFTVREIFMNDGIPIIITEEVDSKMIQIIR